MSEIFGKDALFSFVNEHYGIEPDTRLVTMQVRC